jgi:hypothetical protein
MNEGDQAIVTFYPVVAPVNSLEKVGFQLLSLHQLKLLICFIIMATAAEQAESTRRPG